MALQDDIYIKIKEEITNDPSGIGYINAKTDAELMDMLNNPVPRSSTNYYIEQSPMSRILNGVALAPNIIVEKDVADAQKIII